ncbi:MAG: tripartite tricarboxylate transporter substrate binding protein [Betaproteobacteria bacterium]|nr:tripartite tricarboxylate transporter substrate binding protein [Betaproteobacteria bacterium]
MSGTTMKIMLGCFFLLLIAMGASGVAAQTYPNKPVRFIVPFTPGGSADSLARVVGQKLQEKWRVPVIIDNRGGAGANIGAQLAAAAPPDGYTIFQFNIANAIAISVYKKLNYDPIKDFSPVTLLAMQSFILVATPAINVGSMQELIALAKAQPGKVIYASSGIGGSSHLAGELLKTVANINLLHVPYKGSGPALSDVLSGQVHLLFNNLMASLPLVKAGKLRAVGVTSAKRSPLAPELPTIAESGAPGYEAGTWYGVVTPAHTPRAVVNKLYTDVKQVVEIREVHKQLSGYELVGSSPEQFAQFLKAEVERWGRVVKFAGVQID